MNPKLVMRNIAVLLVLLAAVAGMSYAGAVREGSLNGFSNGTSIVIRWQSDDESRVQRVEIERQVGVDGPFITLREIQLKGSDQAYEYVDDSAFRLSASLYNYRLKVQVAGTSLPVYFGPISVSHNVNSVRRTWGSIKAMFR
jgi:hypothetical protein